ncbi:hypothetical protein GCM10022277_35890 [Litoribacillus peritrichatus]|uniref:Alginate export domain-containing protein n=2 Tax=Litoribacillus peritrichatus TaxID=718191 RepID=A0ABP7N768_9GAMM
MLLGVNVQSAEFEFSGRVGVEGRYFFETAQYEDQLNHGQASVFAEPEVYWGWNDGNDSVTFKPFIRADGQDSERSHGDIRELSYIHAGDDWELRAGIRKEFWGVTEFQHLVDVINQTDAVEDFDGEDKLGQQMINLSVVNDWGIVDLFLLPGFRERTFPGEDGRLRGPVRVDTDDVEYESSAEEKHLDVAARWTHTLGDFDVGTYWFHGTNRDPVLTPTFEDGEVVLKQYYNQMDQVGIDVQATIDEWLWKFETIYRGTDEEDFFATQAGFEYTYVGVFESAADLGWLVEYSWDSRGEGDFDDPGSAFQNDIFFGSRLALNDIQSSELLAGFSSDLDHNAYSFLIEASRRFGESFKGSLDVRMFQSTHDADQIYAIRDDDHVQLTWEWYY